MTECPSCAELRARITQLEQVLYKWQARADRGFDPEETDEQSEFWRGVRNVVEDALADLARVSSPEPQEDR
jgi:hypothetical protein